MFKIDIKDTKPKQSQQEMLNIIIVAVTEIMHASIRNLK